MRGGGALRGVGATWWGVVLGCVAGGPLRGAGLCGVALCCVAGGPLVGGAGLCGVALEIATVGDFGRKLRRAASRSGEGWKPGRHSENFCGGRARMTRTEMLERVEEEKKPWDMLIIGGGATGVGAALDAASRGYSVLLLEQSDFGKGTSSRSTKLVHGGVRYLQQGDVPLVMEALKERGIMRQNAPHLVHDLAFVVPNYTWWEAPFYGIGMKVYDMLAFRYGFGASSILSAEETLARIPTIETSGLRGGVVYYDGQFDDARMLISLVRTAAEQGACLVNYCKVEGLTRDGSGVISGVRAVDQESGREYSIAAKVVLNCCGPFCDNIRRMDDPQAEPMIAPSTGVHIVLDKSFLPGNTAIMVPRTTDGRVMFAIPWNDCVVVGTTDNPIEEPSLEPRPLRSEAEFILENAHDYLKKPPTLADVKCAFSGIRPLVKSSGEGNTAKLSRDHTIAINTKSGLVTMAGGKWTTYRRMAEDLINHAETLAGVEPHECVTKVLNIHGYHRNANKFGHLASYGSDAPALQQMMQSEPKLAQVVHPNFPVTAAQVVWAVRYEMARTVDDVLARRTRCLLYDAKAAREAAPAVAKIMAEQLGYDKNWEEEQVATFGKIAALYLPM